MPIDSDPKGAPRKNGRTARKQSDADISPGLREHIIQAAQRLRGAHRFELADALKADRAARLFRSIIRANENPAGSSSEHSGVSGEGAAPVAAELGALLADAMLAGTDLLVAPLEVFAREWMATAMRPASKPPFGTPAEEPAPEKMPESEPSAGPPVPSTVIDRAPVANPPEAPTPSPEEIMLETAFKRFMPMLVATLNQGGDGYGLAETVISLFGRTTYDQVSGLGKDKIMRIIKSDPALWAQVAPIEAEFVKFMDEFIEYGSNPTGERAEREPDVPVGSKP